MQRGSRPVALLFAVAMTCDGALPVARAAVPEPTPASESERLIDRALDLREARNDRDALPLLARAVRLDPSPRARAQLALGQQGAGQWIQAEQGLQAVLESADTWVTKNRATLEEALATVRRQLGWLEVEANVPGAQVTLDGISVGTVPIPSAVRVAAGVSSLKVIAPGYSPVVRLVQVAAGEHAREVLALQPDVAVTPPDATLPVKALASSGPVLLPPPLLDAPPESPPTTKGRALAWIALGGSATALSGGVAAHVAREGAAAQFNREAVSYDNTCKPQCSGVRPSQANVDVMTGLAVAGYAVGAALGVATAVLFARAGSPTHASTEARVRCGAGALTIWCGGAF